MGPLYKNFLTKNDDFFIYLPKKYIWDISNEYIEHAF